MDIWAFGKESIKEQILFDIMDKEHGIYVHIKHVTMKILKQNYVLLKHVYSMNEH